MVSRTESFYYFEEYKPEQLLEVGALIEFVESTVDEFLKDPKSFGAKTLKFMARSGVGGSALTVRQHIIDEQALDEEAIVKIGVDAYVTQLIANQIIPRLAAFGGIYGIVGAGLGGVVAVSIYTAFDKHIDSFIRSSFDTFDDLFSNTQQYNLQVTDYQTGSILGGIIYPKGMTKFQGTENEKIRQAVRDLVSKVVVYRGADSQTSTGNQSFDLSVGRKIIASSNSLFDEDHEYTIFDGSFVQALANEAGLTLDEFLSLTTEGKSEASIENRDLYVGDILHPKVVVKGDDRLKVKVRVESDIIDTLIVQNILQDVEGNYLVQ